MADPIANFVFERKKGHCELFSSAMVVSVWGQPRVPGAAVLSSEFVFETAPFASAHASTIVETKDGLVAAWLFVGIPLAWGIWETLKKSVALFA